MPASISRKAGTNRKPRPTTITENPAIRRHVEQAFQEGGRSYPAIITSVRRRFRVTLSHSAVSRHWQRWNALNQRQQAS
jgi:hypothetical protein